MTNKIISLRLPAIAAIVLLCCGISYASGSRLVGKPAHKSADSLNLTKPAHIEAHFDPCTEPCPDSAPPTSIPWTGPFTWDGTLEGTDCAVRICYCTRMTSPGNYDFTITRIQTDGPDCPSDINSLVHAAFQTLFDQNPMGFPCPDCGGGSVVYWREVGATCWHQESVSAGFTVPTFDPCPDPCWCMTPYRICCNADGPPTVIQGATVLFCPGGTTCNDPDCVQVDCTQ